MSQKEPAGTAEEGRVLRWEGPGQLPQLPNTNYAAFLLHLMTQHGDNVATVDAETGQQRTYRQLCDLVGRASGGLARAGVGVGDRVLFVTPVHVDYPVVMLSIIHRGAVCVPVNSIYKARELKHMARVSEAHWVVVHEEAVARVEEAFSHLPPRTLWGLWVIGQAPPGKMPFSSLCSGPALPPFMPAEGLDARTSVALMPFSSGTTGLPKGVMLSHTNLLVIHHVAMYTSWVRKLMNEPSRDEFWQVLLLVLPLTHMYGHNILVQLLQLGRRAVFLTKFSVHSYFEAIQKYKVTLAPVTPHFATFLTETPLKQQYDLSSLKMIFTGGATTKPSTFTSARTELGVPLFTAYGVTETSAAGTAVHQGAKRGSAGKVRPYVEIKVINEKGEALEEGEEGELCLRGPVVMLGYAGNQAATEAVLDPHGWYHTGDLGFYDNDGNVFITDRKKDLIKVKGFQVSPHEVEEVLQAHPCVAEAAVVGVPHERTDETPHAVLVLRSGSTVQPQHILSFVADHLTSYKTPTAITFAESIPRNATGKIDRKLIKKLLTTPGSRL